MAELEQLTDPFYLTRLNPSSCSSPMPSSSRNTMRSTRGPGRSVSPALPTTDEYIKQVHETREALRLFNTLHLLNTPVSRVAMEELVNTTVSSILFPTFLPSDSVLRLVSSVFIRTTSTSPTSSGSRSLYALRSMPSSVVSLSSAPSNMSA
jgi:hypothetical protein